MGNGAVFDASALRHVYLAGFGTLLLLGMAPRMGPGFVHRRGLASPLLVDLSFFLGMAAVSLRLCPISLRLLGGLKYRCSFSGCRVFADGWRSRRWRLICGLCGCGT
ncbi:MAG: hypothetical protein ACKVJG_26360 [Candidatus Latescibacterota bacterium]